MPRFALLFVAFGFASFPLGMQAGDGQPTEPGEKQLAQPYRITPRTGAQHIALDGRWELSYRDTAVKDLAELKTVKQRFSVDVPSSVQWALHRAGGLPHPYEHLNSQQYSWFTDRVWYYRRSVALPRLDGEQHLFLCFDGIDYFARVWFNGVLLGRHEGMFGGPAMEVRRLAKPGAANEIVVEVRAGNYGTPQFKSQAVGKVIKPWVLAGGLGAETFFVLGMWQGARIEIVPSGHLERPFLVTEDATAEQARLRLSCEVFAGTHSLELQLHPWKNAQLSRAGQEFRDAWTSSPSKSRFALRVQMTAQGAAQTAYEKTFPLRTFAGRNFVRQELLLDKPQRWWPVGLGTPNLYRVKLTLLRNDAAEDALEFDYGIRTIRTRPTAGPQTTDRWGDWQFEINGQRIFVKGMNWMPADILLDLPRQRYRWLLGMARAAGIQMLRVWGGGIIEPEAFYETCDELGLMVWQDFPIGNQDVPDWPQDVWEAQVLQSIFRLRNHPALAVYCGGNEFNPYSLGNAAAIGILERAVADFDSTRVFRRTSPDLGSLHTYPDMDPTWYGHLYRLVPYISETGMHSIPDAASIRKVVDAREFVQPLRGMFESSFPKAHPELMHHFVEYNPGRVPRMLSRASHIDDMRAPTLERLAEATQIGAGEFYQIVSDQMQANYPVTAGLMPWVFKRPWPVIAIMLVDGFGQPTAPYYFLKRTYEATHVLVRFPHLLWAPGEKLPIDLSVTHALPTACPGLEASVQVLDPGFAVKWSQTRRVDIAPGASVTNLALGQFAIPADFGDKFFFVVAELRARDGQLISRSVYWPRCLTKFSDPVALEKYRRAPQPTLTFDRGPWLKPQTAALTTQLELAVTDYERVGNDAGRVGVRIKNLGSRPAFNTRLTIEGADLAFYAADNYFWLAAGEERTLTLNLQWRGPADTRPLVTVAAWNAAPVQQPLGSAPAATGRKP